jgi:hypothetical protein
LQLLCRKGKAGFLSQDQLLFSKSEDELIKGEPAKRLQWITSVLNGTRWAAHAKNDAEATAVQVKRALMKRWLQHH